MKLKTAIFAMTMLFVSAQMIVADPPVIQAAPDAPVFTDAERQTELAARRARVLERMDDDSIMILFSAEPRIYTGDVDFMYRQENNLYYLTELKQQGATLVLTKSNGKTAEFLFLPKRNPQYETWNGKMYSNEEAVTISGVKTVIDAAEQAQFIKALKEKKLFTSAGGTAIPPSYDQIYMLLPYDRRDNDGVREYAQEAKLEPELKSVNNARPIFDHLRQVKSPYELRILQHAIDISIEAHMRSMAVAARSRWEYEVQAEVEYTYRRRNADYWGYPSIVGCGPNATTLHYEESQGAITPGRLLLMDVGAEYGHYTADITRTFPVNGRFTKEQTEIYQIVYDAQEAAAATIRPGAKISAPSAAALKTIEEGLAKLGLIEKPGALIPGTVQRVPDGKGGTREVGIPQFRLFYMHGWGHWLGMNVHDVGDYSVEFKPGMVMTNEPGIYIREDALDYLDVTKPETKAFVDKIRPIYQKYRGIGVRIEDDMLVTSTGVEWMSKTLPRSVADVERFIERARKELKR